MSPCCPCQAPQPSLLSKVPSALPLPVLTSSAGGPVAAQLTHLAGGSVEALMAAALPATQEPVLALPVARAHTTQTPWARLTQCPKEARTAVGHLQGRGMGRNEKGGGREGEAEHGPGRTSGEGKVGGMLGPQAHIVQQLGPKTGQWADQS